MTRLDTLRLQKQKTEMHHVSSFHLTVHRHLVGDNYQ
jgi:hypothetical protein